VRRLGTAVAPVPAGSQRYGPVPPASCRLPRSAGWKPALQPCTAGILPAPALCRLEASVTALYRRHLAGSGHVPAGSRRCDLYRWHLAGSGVPPGRRRYKGRSEL